MDPGEIRTLGEVAALEPLPDDPHEALEHLRLVSFAEGVIMDRCPECGQDLENIDVQAHADWHWPAKALAEAFQANGGEPTEAHRRKATLLKVGKARAKQAGAKSESQES